MAFLNDTPSTTLSNALRLYWPRLVVLWLQPIVSAILTWAFPGVPRFLIWGGLFLLAAGIAMWPAAFKVAPVGYWLLACAVWFAASTAVLVFGGAA